MACEVFGLARPEILDPWPYELVVCSDDAPRVRTEVGLVLDGVAPLSAADRADTIIVPAGRTHHEARPSDAVLATLRRAHRRGARVLSVCSGAFALAHAGLLDGRRATTHWRHADALAAQFPRIEVDPNVLYVDDGQVMTSAGTASGIDLCLHVVRLDHGADVANAVARRMVVPPHRDGGQAQYVNSPVAIEPAGAPLSSTLDWAVAHLDEPLTVEQLARHAAMSPRTFARRFRDVTGTTPLQWVLRQRIVRAQQLLESTDLSIDHIATECGFGSAAVLRTHFRRMVDTSPDRYRRTFRTRETQAS